MMRWRALAIAAWLVLSTARVVDFEEDAGARAEDESDAAAWANGAALNATFSKLAPGDVLRIPNKTFYVMGGIRGDGLRSVTIQVDGTLAFSPNLHQWPRRDSQGHVADCLTLNDPFNVTVTSSGTGTLDGNGKKWWGFPGIGYLIRAENRPHLIEVHGAKGCLFERLLLKDSPYWTFDAHGDGIEVRHVDIDARRTRSDGHGIIDITAFNTDGFDVSGRNVWIHDCRVWNQDDCIAVKDGSENMLFERITASGLGLTIGSISGSVVRNITFRDCYMHRTVKGIYLKFRDGDRPGSISDVLYENIVMDEPEQAPIWIGPAQQSDSREFWVGHPCSLFWPELPGASCGVPAAATFVNITLRNVTIRNPRQSPGLIFGNATNPMRNIVFDGVKVQNPGKEPWGDKYYKCEGVHGVATGSTWPVPPCFEDRTGVPIVV